MQLFTNNASSMLAAGISAAALSVTVAAGDGASFPNPQNGDFFLATLFQRVGVTEVNLEIVMCTARAGDVLTIVRGQEGTTPFAFNAGDYIELRQTAGSVLPVRNGALTGTLNEAPTVAMASAPSMPIAAAGANTISVSGAANVSAFDAIAAGATRRMVFTGTPTFTHNAVSMKCLGGASITAGVGDSAEWLSLGGGNWQMIAYARANGGVLTSDPSKAGLASNTYTGAQLYAGVAKGAVASGTVTFALSAGNVQTLTVAGALTIALSGFPAAGVFADLLIKLTNGGSATLTLPTIKWILPATGAPAASFSAYLTAIGRAALQTAGTDFIYLWSDDNGATIYGKLL